MTDRWDTLRKAIDHVTREGDWAEFGVSAGHSARVLLDRLPEGRALWLFDSWEGLPEAWGPHPMGRYACKPPCIDDPRTKLVQGRFEDTVAAWASGRTDPLALVHIDCDLYTSTSVVLDAIRPLLARGSIVCMDEHHGFDYCEEHEGRAWAEARIPSRELAVGPTQLVVAVMGEDPAAGGSSDAAIKGPA